MPFNPKMNLGSLGSSIGVGGEAEVPAQKSTPSQSPPKETKADSVDEALTDALSSADQKNQELQERVQQLSEELQNKEKELIEVKSRITELKAKSSEKKDDTYELLIAERERAEKCCELLKDELEQARANLDDLRTRAEFLEIEKIDLKAKIKDLEDNALLPATDHSDHLKRIQEFEQANNKLIQQLSKAERSNTELLEKIKQLNEEVSKQQNDLSKASEKAHQSELDLLEEKRQREQAEEKIRLFEKFLQSIDPEPDGNSDLRNERITDAFQNGVVERVKVVEKLPLGLIVFIVLTSILAGGMLGYTIRSYTGLPTTETAMISVPPHVASADVPPNVQTALAGQVTVLEDADNDMNQSSDTGPEGVEETCYPANSETIRVLLNQKTEDNTVFGKVNTSALKGERRITCNKELKYENGRTDLSECEICVPYGPGEYSVDQEHLKAILGRDDPSCYDYRHDGNSLWTKDTIHIWCDNTPEYSVPGFCRDVSNCKIVVPNLKTKCAKCGNN